MEVGTLNTTPWAPWPYWGGKRTVAAEVWARFGDVRNFVEPFCGSAAVLLARPQPFHGTETVGDLDAILMNVWRALKWAPEKVALYCTDPPNSCDMAARRLALDNAAEHLPKMLDSDPEAFDARLAGFWLYNQACWLNGVKSSETRQAMPRLWRNGMGVCRYRNDDKLMADLLAIQDRLRYVRMVCGDWKRTLTFSSLQSHGLSAVFLDPPYGVEDRYELYAKDSRSISREVFDWAVKNQHDPLLRIGVCGYAGEHEFPDCWDVFKWTSHGFISKSGGQGRINRERERIWFSPACLKPGGETVTQLTLGLLKEDY